MDTTNETVRNALTSTIGKWIAGLFAVVLAPVLPALINFVNEVLGYGLTDAQVQAYSKTASLAIAGVLVTWLLNRGLFERKALEAAASPTNAVNPDAGGEEITPDRFEDPADDPEGDEFVPPDFEEINAEIESNATDGFEEPETGAGEDIPAIEEEGEPPIKGAPLGNGDEDLPKEDDAR